MASRGKRFSSTEAVRNLDSSLIDVHWSVWGVKPCWIANATQTVGEEKVHTGYAACCEYGWKPQNTCSADAWTASTMRILATEPGRGGVGNDGQSHESCCWFQRECRSCGCCLPGETPLSGASRLSVCGKRCPAKVLVHWGCSWCQKTP